MSAMIKNPISFENSLLNARYSPVITIATNTNDWALLCGRCALLEEPSQLHSDLCGLPALCLALLQGLVAYAEHGRAHQKARWKVWHRNPLGEHS